MLVTIIRRPDGEAPEWVRDAWIGLRLPAACPRRHVMRSFGVLSGPTGLFQWLWAVLSGRSIRVEGYAVNAKEAVDLLGAAGRPDAAAWWREHAPHLLDGCQYFAFEAAACQAGDERAT